MRIVFTKLNDSTGALWDSPTSTITVDHLKYKKAHPKYWRRIVIAAIAHELTHAIMEQIKPAPDRDIYGLYKEELICYKVQAFFEYILTGQFQWADKGIEWAAILSTKSTIRFFAGYGNLC